MERLEPSYGVFLSALFELSAADCRATRILPIGLDLPGAVLPRNAGLQANSAQSNKRKYSTLKPDLTISSYKKSNRLKEIENIIRITNAIAFSQQGFGRSNPVLNELLVIKFGLQF